MDSNPFVETFLRETEDLLGALEDGLLELEWSPENAETIDRLFRAAHTLKGNAGMVGFTELVHLTHVLENVLDRLRSRMLVAAGEILEALFAGVDALKVATERFARGEPFEASADYDSALDSLSALSGIDSDEPALLAERLYEIKLQLRADAWNAIDDSPSLLEELGMLGEIVEIELLPERVPLLAELDTTACQLGFRIVLKTCSGPMGVTGVCFFSVEEQDLQITLLEPPSHSDPDRDGETERARGAEIEAETKLASAPAKALASAAQPSASAKTAPSAVANRASSIRVATDKLARLTDLVGELVIGISQVSDATGKASAGTRAAALERLESLGRDLQDQVMSLRMLPIQDTFERFRRPIRDLAKELGKEIEFSMLGGETQVDKQVIDSLVDPLKHMLRNCVSHGLETPDERVSYGKPPAGQVRLCATQREGHVVIEVSDDGRGINGIRVQEKAEERGLISRGQALSEAEMHDLLFLPGFSTAAEISEISGRGVGLDVVRRNIQALRGSVEIASRLGHGTTFRIRLPLTLAIVEGMNVRVGAETVTIPLHSVVELIAPGPKTVRTMEGKHEYIDVRGELLPVLRLSDMLSLQEANTVAADARVVLVETERRKFGLLVDCVLGMGQTVIKPLDRSYELCRRMDPSFVKPRGVGGAAILGDGNVGIILDVHGLESTAFGAA